MGFKMSIYGNLDLEHVNRKYDTKDFTFFVNS